MAFSYRFSSLLSKVCTFFLNSGFSQNSYRSKIFTTFILLSMFSSELIIAMEKTQDKIILKKNLIFPDPRKLYMGPTLHGTLQEKNASFKKAVKETVELKLKQDLPSSQNLQQVINSLIESACYGNSQAMHHIGVICEEQQVFDLAMRWYVLSFQTDWFSNSARSYFSSSYKKLEELANEKKNKIEKIILFLYPLDIDTAEKKFGRYNALIEFYKNRIAEPYLDEEEIDLKIQRLKKEIELVLQDSQHQCKIVEDYLDIGMILANQKKYLNAETYFLESSLPDALHNLGWLYEEGHISMSGMSGYERAAELYKKAQTINSFNNLGRLYKEGWIGKISNKPNYKKAIKYLELSGTPEALINLGILFKEGHVGQINGQPDYQTAKNYFERSKTDDAYVRLGELYMLGYIGDNYPQPDYQKAEFYFDKAASNGYLSAFCKLGHLCLQGHIDTIYGQPNYKSAIKYFQEAARSSDPLIKSNAFYNLGAAYVKGHIGQINGQSDYEQAKIYFDQSIMPESYYNIGNLYECGHIGAKPDYINALHYYELSNLPRAQIAILGLYQLGYVKQERKEEKQKIINNIVEKINRSLSTLSLDESYYIKGIAEYYLGNLEAAFISLQNALSLGNEEEELLQLIEEIGGFLEEKAQEKLVELMFEPEKEEVQVTDNFEIKHETLDLPIAPTEEEKLEKSVISVSEGQAILIKKKKLTREIKSILKAYRSKQKFLSFKDVNSKNSKLTQLPLQFIFLNQEDQINFESVKNSNTKLQEILQDIQDNCWVTTGVGKPEVLKYPFKGYKGCLSRRLNCEDRLVYKVIKSGIILVLSWGGHYT